MAAMLFVSKRLQCAALAVILMVGAQVTTAMIPVRAVTPPGGIIVAISR